MSTRVLLDAGASQTRKQTINSLREKFSAKGIEGVTLVEKGESIEIEIQGKITGDKLESTKTKTSKLEFRLCNDETKFLEALAPFPKGVELVKSTFRPIHILIEDTHIEFSASKLNAVKAFLEGRVPDDVVVMFGGAKDKKDSQKMRSYTLSTVASLTQEHVSSAYVTSGSQYDLVAVGIRFNDDGRDILAKLSMENIGKRFAIIVDDEVESAPYFASPSRYGPNFIWRIERRRSQEGSIGFCDWFDALYFCTPHH